MSSFEVSADHIDLPTNYYMIASDLGRGRYEYWWQCHNSMKRSAQGFHTMAECRQDAFNDYELRQRGCRQ